MRQMKTVLVIVLMFSPCGVAAGNGDPCLDTRRSESDARIVLQTTTLDEQGIFVGKFVIENVSKKSIVIKGELPESGGQIRIVRPDYSIEYLDLSNQWQERLELPGSFLGAKGERSIPPGKSSTFTVSLMSANYGSRSANDFRLLVRTKNLSACLVSVPFRGYPPRPEVIRLETADGAE
jgi:hypothetical protein